MSEESAYALFKDRKLSVITFSTKDAAFAIPLQQVLYIEKDVKRNIQLDELKSFNHEVITYQNNTVELYDFNKLIGSDDHQNRMSALMTDLDDYETAHLNWIEQIETAIQHQSGAPAKPEKVEELLKWTRTYSNTNAELTEVINSLEEPSTELQKDLERTCQIMANQEQAQSMLKRTQENSLKAFHNHLQQAKERAENSIRPIILFVEHDNNRVSALRLDNIKDIIDYDWSNFSTDNSSEGLMKRRVDDYHIEGFLRNEDTAPLMLINCKTETAQLPEKQSQVA
jgi:hypothetical protein